MGPRPPLFAHSCKATVLAWFRQMFLDRTLRRIQGHCPSNFTDVTISVQCWICKLLLINHIRAGLTGAQIPSAPLPALGLNSHKPLLFFSSWFARVRCLAPHVCRTPACIVRARPSLSPS